MFGNEGIHGVILPPPLITDISDIDHDQNK